MQPVNYRGDSGAADGGCGLVNCFWIGRSGGNGHHLSGHNGCLIFPNFMKVISMLIDKSYVLN